mmetsp:Transcript_33375/g.61222  ORF Transcript_33375/g.61222 Transcript_33375/m.61222 type:complete len:422 (+) Transcript_33375:86-1351(+)
MFLPPPEGTYSDKAALLEQGQHIQAVNTALSATLHEVNIAWASVLTSTTDSRYRARLADRQLAYVAIHGDIRSSEAGHLLQRRLRLSMPTKAASMTWERWSELHCKDWRAGLEPFCNTRMARLRWVAALRQRAEVLQLQGLRDTLAAELAALREDSWAAALECSRLESKLQAATAQRVPKPATVPADELPTELSAVQVKAPMQHFDTPAVAAAAGGKLRRLAKKSQEKVAPPTEPEADAYSAAALFSWLSGSTPANAEPAASEAELGQAAGASSVAGRASMQQSPSRRSSEARRGSMAAAQQFHAHAAAATAGAKLRKAAAKAKAAQEKPSQPQEEDYSIGATILGWLGGGGDDAEVAPPAVEAAPESKVAQLPAATRSKLMRVQDASGTSARDRRAEKSRRRAAAAEEAAATLAAEVEEW